MNRTKPNSEREVDSKGPSECREIEGRDSVKADFEQKIIREYTTGIAFTEVIYSEMPWPNNSVTRNGPVKM